jgi:cis-3-alkyl-4-acyloxetan-2-one decarboxylase
MTNPHDWRALYPFRSQEVLLDGRRCHYLDEGEGPVLLVLHGNPTWSFYWREVVKALRGRYRLVVPDLIGCGLSEKPSPREYSYRLARRVADIGELVERLGLDRVTLVAHDWGGAIGMGAAVAMPERFKRFVLMNTAAFRATRCPARIRLAHIPVLSRVAVQGLNLFVRGAIHMSTTKPLGPAVRAGLLAPYDSWRNREGVYRFVQDIPLRPNHPSHATLQGIEEGLPKLRGRPMCFIWGMQDWIFPPEFLERFIEIFPEAEVHRLEDAGHYVVEDASERIVRIMEGFLEKSKSAE